MSERAFEFTGPEGLTRRAIENRPEGRTQTTGDTGIVLLPAGLKYRAGPSRMNVQLARSFEKAGYPVLRFDPLGIGESDGAIEDAPMHAMYDSIVQGRFVDDTLLGCAVARERFGVNKIIVGGLCGGAITAMLAGASQPGAIQGLLLLSTPITLSGADSKIGGPALSPGLARHHSRAYAKKLFSPDAWKRVLRLESNFSGVFAALKMAAVDKLRPRKAAAAMATVANESPLFMQAFTRLNQHHTAQLYLFGGSDNRWVDFDTGIVQPRLRGQLRGPSYDIKVLREANHEFQSGSARQHIVAEANAWLAQRFPIHQALPQAALGAAVTAG